MPASRTVSGHGAEKNAPNWDDSATTLLTEAQWAYLQRRYDLTARERQVAELVCQGLKNNGIASRLKVRPETVKTHVRNIFRKTRVRSKILLLVRFVTDTNRIEVRH